MSEQHPVEILGREFRCPVCEYAYFFVREQALQSKWEPLFDFAGMLVTTLICGRCTNVQLFSDSSRVRVLKNISPGKPVDPLEAAACTSSVFILGGEGQLGSAFKRHYGENALALGRTEADLCSPRCCAAY
ncbi:MAG: hypothetical protein QM811_02920 [Pirellulales bacterium]